MKAIRYVLSGLFIEITVGILKPTSSCLGSGRFGYGEVIKLKKDDYTITSSFVRSLRACFTSDVYTPFELETLIGLKCKYEQQRVYFTSTSFRHLAEVQDFQHYHIGMTVPPIILVRYAFYEGNLFDRLKSLKYPIEMSKYILWCYQVHFLLSFFKKTRPEKPLLIWRAWDIFIAA